MLAPHETTAFFAATFEREPLHVERGDAAYFAGVYGVGDVEDALIVGAREPEQFALFKGGSGLAAEEFTYERPSVRWRLTGKPPRRWVDARRVVSHFADGYTVIIKDAALFSARLQRFCNRLQCDLFSIAQANVYYTPPAAQGFAVHHDTHDTLTAQIEGEKTWLIYEPVVRLPMESKPFHSGTKMPGLRLLREVRVRAGDTLYIPRGFPHEAKTSGGTSLHCTFALLPIRIADVTDMLAHVTSDADVELRRALRPGELSAERLARRAAASYDDPEARATLERRTQEALDITVNELFRLTRPNADDAFARALRALDVTADTPVRIDEGVPFMLRERAQSIELLIAGKAVAFPKFCVPAFTRLQEGPTTAGEMDPSLSPENRALFVKLLVLEGLVVAG